MRRWIGWFVIQILRPVSSMLTSPLRYNFPPLSMRITSWIVKKKSVYAEKIVRKKVELVANFFVCLVCSLIILSFSSNQIEETTKQTKLRRRKVDHSLMVMLSVWKTIQNCLLLLYVFTNSKNNRKNYCISSSKNK